MRLVALSCPRCGGNVDIYEDRIFGQCLYCEQKIMIEGDTAQKVDVKMIDQYSLLFEEAKFAVETEDHKRIKEIGKQLSVNPQNPHGWLLRGCVALNNDDYEPGTYNDEKKNQSKAASCWKRAAQYLESQYFLNDYSEIIGLSLARVVNEGQYDCEECDIHKIIQPFLETVEKKFNIDFTSELYYWLYVCYKKHLSSIDEYERHHDPLSDMMLNSIAYDPDYKSLIRKCKDILNYDIDEYLDQHHIFQQFLDTFTEKTRGLSSGERERIASIWSVERMEEELGDAWTAIMNSCEGECTEYEDDEDEKPSLLSRLSGIFRRKNKEDYEDEDSYEEGEQTNGNLEENMGIYADLYLNPKGL